MKEKSLNDLDLKKDISKYNKFTRKAKWLESVPSNYAQFFEVRHFEADYKNSFGNERKNTFHNNDNLIK